MKDFRSTLLNRIQTEFPVSPTPYADLALEFDVSESEVISTIEELKSDGLIRRIGAIVDSRTAGYVSTLAGCRVEPEKLEEIAEIVGRNRGVTHSYERDDSLNFWFTVIASDYEMIDEFLSTVSRLPGVIELHSMPTDKVYKIKVHFKK